MPYVAARPTSAQDEGVQAGKRILLRIRPPIFGAAAKSPSAARTANSRRRAMTRDGPAVALCIASHEQPVHPRGGTARPQLRTESFGPQGAALRGRSGGPG